MRKSRGGPVERLTRHLAKHLATCLVIIAVVGVAGAVLIARHFAAGRAGNPNPDSGSNPNQDSDSAWVLLAPRLMSPVEGTRADGTAIMIEQHGTVDKDAIAAAAALAFEQGGEEALVDGKPQASPKPEALVLRTGGAANPGDSAKPGGQAKTSATGFSIVKLDVAGHEAPIYVRRVKMGNEYVLAAEPGTGTPYLHRSPRGTHYALVSDGHLILIDARTLTATNLTPDTIDGFDRWSLWKKANQGTPNRAFVWADNPVWAPDGSRLLYISNRKAIQDDVEGSASEIWSVDVGTGRHEVLHSGTYFRRLLACYGDRLVFAELDRVAYLSLSTGQVRTLVEDGRVIGEATGGGTAAVAGEASGGIAGGVAGGIASVVVTVEDYLTSSTASVTDVATDGGTDTASARSVDMHAPVGTAFVRVAVSPSGRRFAAIVRDGSDQDAVAVYEDSGDGEALTLLSVFPLPDGFRFVTGEQFVSESSLVISLYQASGGKVSEATYLLSTRAAGGGRTASRGVAGAPVTRSGDANLSVVGSRAARLPGAQPVVTDSTTDSLRMARLPAARLLTMDDSASTPWSATYLPAAHAPATYLPVAYSPAGYSGPYDDNIAFGNSGPGAGAISEFSPLREGSPTTEAFPPVTSKFNQPRHVSATNSNPHQGLDVNAVAADVYVVRNGWISAKTSDSITIRIDADNDGVADDNLFVTYNHLRRVTARAVGSAVSYTDVIAQVDVSIVGPHLHFGNRSDLAGDGIPEWVKNEPYYRSSQGWNAGQDLDLVSCAGVFGGRVTAQVYVKDEGRTVQMNEGDVRIFYRLAGSGGPWIEAAMVKESSSTFSFDLAAHTGYKQVNFLIRVERTDQKASSPGDYYWAFDPPKQMRPNPDPSRQGEPDYYSVMLKK